MQRRTWAALLVSAILVCAARDVSAAESASTPFDGPNATFVQDLARGATVRHQSADNSLTNDDRARLRGLGLRKLHSSAVVMHKIPRTDGPRQIGRLRMLTHAVAGFAPSEACDGIVSQGDSVGLCTGSVDGPLGKVPVRMPVSAKLEENATGPIRLVITNHRPMEAKPLLGWSEVVAPGHLKVVYEMFPTDDGWLVYTRVGVEMSAHEGSAKTISDALLKLDGWLTRELAKS